MFETTVSEIGAHGKILEDAVFSLADIRDRQLAVAVTQQLAGASTFSGWTADGNTVYMHANKFPASSFPYWGPTGTPTDFVPVEWNIQVQDSVVTINGQVPDEATRERLIKLVSGVDGVKQVVSELLVSR